MLLQNFPRYYRRVVIGLIIKNKRKQIYALLPSAILMASK